MRNLPGEVKLPSCIVSNSRLTYTSLYTYTHPRSLFSLTLLSCLPVSGRSYSLLSLPSLLSGGEVDGRPGEEGDRALSSLSSSIHQITTRLGRAYSGDSPYVTMMPPPLTPPPPPPGQDSMHFFSGFFIIPKAGEIKGFSEK